MAGLELVGNDEYRFIARGSGGLGNMMDKVRLTGIQIFKSGAALANLALDILLSSQDLAPNEIMSVKGARICKPTFVNQLYLKTKSFL